MTYDELLAVVQNSYSGIPDHDGNWKANQALRVAVELHKPIKSKLTGADICNECSKNDEIGTGYPCLTIQSIEKELK